MRPEVIADDKCEVTVNFHGPSYARGHGMYAPGDIVIIHGTRFVITQLVTTGFGWKWDAQDEKSFIADRYIQRPTRWSNLLKWLSRGRLTDTWGDINASY